MAASNPADLAAILGYVPTPSPVESPAAPRAQSVLTDAQGTAPMPSEEIPSSLTGNKAPDGERKQKKKKAKSKLADSVD